LNFKNSRSRDLESQNEDDADFDTSTLTAEELAKFEKIGLTAEMLKNDEENDIYVLQAAALNSKAWQKMFSDAGSQSEMSEIEETLTMKREW